MARPPFFQAFLVVPIPIARGSIASLSLLGSDYSIRIVVAAMAWIPSFLFPILFLILVVCLFIGPQQAKDSQSFGILGWQSTFSGEFALAK